MVYYRPPGEKRFRKFFETKGAASKFADETRRNFDESGTEWILIPRPERSKILAAYYESKAAGFSLGDAVSFFKMNREKPNGTDALGDALARFKEECTLRRLSPRRTRALHSTLNRFISGRETSSIGIIGREDVLSWLKRPDWSPRTFNTYLAHLSAFFNWAVSCDILHRSPCAKISPIGALQMPDIDTPPKILSFDQCKKLLDAARREDPTLIPYIAVCLFAGLRPEREAGDLQWQDVDLEKGIIFVKGLHAKDRRQRHVAIQPVLKTWLELGGDLPARNIRRRFQHVREAAGLIKRMEKGEKKSGVIVNTGWEQDIMRHTFASNYLPEFGAEKTREALGHGNYEMLFRHYRALVQPDQAKAFWNLLPSKLAGDHRLATVRP